MKPNRLTFLRIAAIVFIFICATIAWFTLGTALVIRTEQSSAQLDGLVSESWGEPLTQSHPTAWFASPTGAEGKQFILPDGADVRVVLEFDPKQKGLLWYRTFWVEFEGEYRITNPTPIAQTLFVSFALPSAKTSFYDVEFLLGDESVTRTAPVDGVLSRAVVVAYQLFCTGLASLFLRRVEWIDDCDWCGRHVGASHVCLGSGRLELPSFGCSLCSSPTPVRFSVGPN